MFFLITLHIYQTIFQGCETKSWEMGSEPGSPISLEDKAHLNLLDF